VPVRRLIRGRTILPGEPLLSAHLHDARYQYPPYLFEALMQLAAFHMLAMDPRTAARCCR